jgi:hypothetical protein
MIGLCLNHVAGLREQTAANGPPAGSKPKAVIYLFLSGSLGQHDSFDIEPDAPENIRGRIRRVKGNPQ